MSATGNNVWLHRYAVLTALATLMLLGIGGLVTSHEAGMSVPDWPTSYGYGMFFLPIKFWTGGVFYEHTHRLWASLVGLLVVGLTRWVGGRASRGPLTAIGLIEVLAGLGLLWLRPELKGAGHFLAGIGGAVLLVSAIWARNPAAAAPLPQLGWLAFGLVQFQGLLGGLRVLWFKDEIGIFHAMLAQLFFVLTCAIALFTSRWWARYRPASGERGELAPAASQHARRIALVTTLLILGQLVLGATLRHQHAGLAIPDFPLAYGRLWPAMDADSVARYNQQRVETLTPNAITAFQIGLQMAHRLMALLILAGVGILAWQARKPSMSGSPLRRLSMVWLGLILAQIGLGAATIWTNKAADIATAHVLAGALSLVTGAVWCIIGFRPFAPLPGTQPGSAPFGARDSYEVNPAMAAGK